jgi:hypothetical protein
MMERIKRRMIAVNSLEVMRRTFKVGLVLSEETESDLEYDLGMSPLIVPFISLLSWLASLC